MKSLVYYNPILALKEVAHTSQGKLLSAMQTLFYPGTCVLDRSSLQSIPLRMSVLEPLPTSGSQMSFEEVCVQTVDDLFRASVTNDRKLCILYSGGVDSVLIMAAIEHTLTETYRKRIVVAMNPWSINENPSFYNRIIRGRYEMINSTQINKLFNNRYLLVTGNQPGMLFGNDPLIDTIKGTFKLSDTTSIEQANEVFKQNEMFRSNGIDSLFVKLASICPIKLNNLRDYCWWVAFCIRWQGTSQLVWKSQTAYQSISRKDYQEELVNFFATPLMQQWALAGRDFCNELAAKGGYKVHQKELINRWTGDTDIFDKRKIGSTSFGMARVVPATKFITHESETDTIHFMNEGTLEEFFL